jgi:hypothetical protein
VPDVGGQLGVMCKVNPQGMGSIDHAVVGSDMNRGVRRHTRHETGEATVDQLQLVTPLPGLAAMDVPHLVEVSPVEIDEGTLARPNCGQCRIHPGIKRTRRCEATAAQRRGCQPGAVEEARADADHGHAVCDDPFEHGLARLPQTRIRAVVPGQLVEQPVLTRNEHLIADQSVGAGG